MSEAAASTPTAGADGPRFRRPVERAWALSRTHAFVITLLSAAFFIRVFWAVVTPAFQTPDEPQHFAYVQSLGEDIRVTPSDWISVELGTVEGLTGLANVPFHADQTQTFAQGTLEGPKQADIDALPGSLRTEDDTTRANSASNYPPTYYLIASVVYRMLTGYNVLTIVFGVRVLSALMSTVTVLFSYLTFQRFFKEERLARASALIIAALPMYAYSGAAVNPDVLVWVMFAVFLYLATRAFDEGLSMQMNVAIGATLVAGTLVKQTFLVAVPMYAILLGFLWYKKMLTPREAASALGVVLAMLAVFAGWLYVSGIIRTSPSYPGEHERQARTIVGFIKHIPEHWGQYSGTFEEIWGGSYGWLDTPVSWRIYSLADALSAVATVGLVFYLVATIVDRKPDLKAMFYVLIGGTYVAAWVVLNYLRITSGEAWLLQGRYFFPVIVVLVALLLRGLMWYIPHARARDVLLVALAGGVLWLQTDAIAGYVIPRFYA